MGNSVPQWQRTNLTILLHELATPTIDLVKHDLLSRGWPDHATSQSISHYETLLFTGSLDELTPFEREFRDSLEKWLGIYNVYQFARELFYVPQEVPNDIAVGCGELLGFPPILEFVNRRPYPLISQLFIGLSASESSYSDWSDDDVDAFKDACADVLHATLRTRHDRFLPVFFDCLVRDVESPRGLETIAAKLTDLPKEAGLPIQDYLNHHDTGAVLGMILFATLAVELSEACDRGGSPSDRLLTSTALLYAPWFEVLDETRLTPLNTAYSELTERRLMSEMTRKDSVRAIQAFRAQIYAPA